MRNTVELNPYAPPRNDVNGSTLPTRFRVRNSRVTLGKFQNLCGSKLLGIVGWTQAKLARGLLDRQLIDAPKPFLDDLCDVSQVPERILAFFTTVSDVAKTHGCGSPLYSLSKSTGVPCIGGAVGMLHESGDYFVQASASAMGPVLLGEVHVVSVADTKTAIEIFVTSSGRPKYKRPPAVHA